MKTRVVSELVLDASFGGAKAPSILRFRDEGDGLMVTCSRGWKRFEATLDLAECDRMRDVLDLAAAGRDENAPKMSMDLRDDAGRGLAVEAGCWSSNGFLQMAVEFTVMAGRKPGDLWLFMVGDDGSKELRAFMIERFPADTLEEATA